MKTILIAHNYTQSSFAAMSYNLAHYLANLGHKVVFISHQPYFEEHQIILKGKGEIIVCSWPTLKRPTSLQDFIWFTKLYLEYKPNVVIGHFVGSNITILVSKMLSFGKTKTLEYYHTLTNAILIDLEKITLKQKLLFFRKKLFYKLFCDTLICPSEMAKKDLDDFFNIKKGVVVCNPMLDRFIKKEIISKETIIISYLGRLEPTKGIVDLIKAFQQYKNENPATKIILNIAGFGSLESEIINLSKMNASINFLGGLTYDKIDDYLNKSHFTIIPSKFDNLPTVGLESLMNQTPLLISNTTGLTPFLEEGKECFKFDSTLDSMCLLFEKIVNNIDKIEQMSLNARATYIEKFSMEKYYEAISKHI